MAAGPAASPRTAEDFPVAALDGQALAGIRGGFSSGSGVVVTFSFQQATFVNNNLAQSVIVPTFTVSPDAPAAATITAGTSNSGVPAALGNATNQVQLSAAAATVQSTINNGLTRVFSSLGAGGVSNTISNSANDQLVRQVITANIDINGLSKILQPSVASAVMSRLQAANAPFR